MKFGNWLDEYDREARLVPALLALLPLALVAIGFGFDRSALLGTVLAVLVSLGLPVLIAKQVGELGRSLEVSLFAAWGAPPTTLLLVPALSVPMGAVQRERRARLERASGVTLPTSATLSSAEAEVYWSAVRWLIEQTRDRDRHPVVWKELKAYGFERNTLALRGIALPIAGAGMFALIVGSVASLADAAVSFGATLALAPLCGFIGLGWWLIPTESRVRSSAERYAARLLDASANLT